MDAYHIALFVHVCALLAAIAASATLHLAVARRGSAPHVRESLEWHVFAMKTSRVFPIAIAVLVLSGGYMLSQTTAAAWSNGFVVAGLTGAVLLLACGIFLSVKAKALKSRLEQLVAQSPDEPLRLPPNAVIQAVTRANLGIVLGVVFDMTTKPSTVEALSAVALGVVVLVVGGMVRDAARAGVKEATTA